MPFELGHRRAEVHLIDDQIAAKHPPFAPEEINAFTDFDLIYRSLCALMFNYVPMSGHPGGSVSSGRFVACALFDSMDYDLSKPERADADLISYAAGHKALGLYAMWALRNEIARVGCPELQPSQIEPPTQARGSARFSPQSCHRHTSFPGQRGQTSGRSSDTRNSLRTPLDRCLWCRPADVARPCCWRDRFLSCRPTPGSHRRR